MEKKIDQRFNDALNLVKEKQFTEAISFLEKLINRDQKNIKYHHLKGTIHFNLDEINDAINSFSNAINIDETNFNMLYLRGAAYTNKGNFNKAELDFKKAIYLKSDFSEAYFGLGTLYAKKNENIIAIRNYIKSIQLKNTFRQPFVQLIKILTQTKNVNSDISPIVSKHNEINKLNLNINFNHYIEDKVIYELISKLNIILKDFFTNFNFKETQVYRRNKLDLNCKRHKKIFNTYSIIPKFCFGCYKIQIEPNNLIDLIKIYLIFDNIKLKNNNTRKCMVEKRENIEGNYKALIYCNSYQEAENIADNLNGNLLINLQKKIKISIKRGCSEYAKKFDKYNNFGADRLNYNDEWYKFENLIDEKFDHLKKAKESLPTIQGLTLNDSLIINNWISYAKNINDESVKF